MGAKCTGKRTGRVVDSRVCPSGKARYVAPGTVVRLTAVIADDTGATVSLYTIHCQRTGRPISMAGVRPHAQYRPTTERPQYVDTGRLAGDIHGDDERGDEEATPRQGR